jgi:SAM-dependent methyltransferase
MSVEWYDMIAKRNGGYKSDAIYSVIGLSGETVFEEKLVSMLPNYKMVLDAGCGHGEFTLKMAKYATDLTGIDFSIELIKIAKSLKMHHQFDNVRFIYASTKDVLPFEDGQFDLIYDRRGPTSILNHSRILRSGGTVFGIHSAEKNKVLERLEVNGFIDIEVKEYDEALILFPNEKEFAKHLSSMHGNPYYTLQENREELDNLIIENMRDGKLSLKEWRYVWKAKKP